MIEYKFKLNFFGRIDEGKGIVRYDVQNFSAFTPFGFSSFTELVVEKNNNMLSSAWNSSITYSYLLKFDGQDWFTFDTLNNNQPILHGIYSLGVDQNNNIWIGGSEKDGIIKFDHNT